MRTLKFTTPNMTGTDVTAWQKFLIAKGRLAGPASGTFDSPTDVASRAYQASRGLTPDGVIGPTTVSQAVRDGFRGPNGKMAAGMDASVDCTRFTAQIAGEQIKFIVRYYSRTSSKAMRASEAVALSAAGFQVGAVYEDRNDDVSLFTTASGRQQAAEALNQAAGVGQPAGSAIYFAVDCDPSDAQIHGAVTDYFQGVRQVFTERSAHYRVGIYGSGAACKAIHAAGLASLTWLCGSGGFNGTTVFRTQADIVQIAPSRNIPGGLNIDDNIALSVDIGTFRLPAAHAAKT